MTEEVQLVHSATHDPAVLQPLAVPLTQFLSSLLLSRVSQSLAVPLHAALKRPHLSEQKVKRPPKAPQTVCISLIPSCY